MGRVGRVWSGVVGCGRARSVRVCVCGGAAAGRRGLATRGWTCVTAQLVLRVYLTSEWTLTRDLRAMTTDIYRN